MPFEFIPQALSGLMLIRPRVFPDERGFFLETWKRSDFEAAGIAADLLQDNHSFSHHGALRGLHYQLPPHEQGKLVRVVEGRVFDVCVDLRRASPTFGHWEGLQFDGGRHEMLYVPPGFAHGFVVLSASAHFLYRCTREYAPGAERGIRWDDSDLAIDWPLRDVVVSSKDAALPSFRKADVFEDLPA